MSSLTWKEGDQLNLLLAVLWACVPVDVLSKRTGTALHETFFRLVLFVKYPVVFHRDTCHETH